MLCVLLLRWLRCPGAGARGWPTSQLAFNDSPHPSHPQLQSALAGGAMAGISMFPGAMPALGNAMFALMRQSQAQQPGEAPLPAANTNFREPTV